MAGICRRRYLMAHSKLTNYFASIISLVTELRADVENRPSYRIIEIIESPQNICTVKINIVGKQNIFICSPVEIAAHDGFLEGFSKKDIRTITYLATRAICAPTIEILEQRIDPSTNEMLFRLANKNKNQIFEKSATEIAKNIKLLERMTPQDAKIIGFAICAKSYDQESKELEQLKAEKK